MWGELHTNRLALPYCVAEQGDSVWSVFSGVCYEESLEGETLRMCQGCRVSVTYESTSWI